jgi:hypothetical protein
VPPESVPGPETKQRSDSDEREPDYRAHDRKHQKNADEPQHERPDCERLEWVPRNERPVVSCVHKQSRLWDSIEGVSVTTICATCNG